MLHTIMSCNSSLRLFSPLLLIGLTGYCSTSSYGQIRVWKPGQESFSAPQAVAADKAGQAVPSTRLQEKRMDVTPAAEPRPALRYRFWKAPALRTQGSVNSAMHHAMLLYLAHPRRAELDRAYADMYAYWDETKPRQAQMTSEIQGRMQELVESQAEVLRAVYTAAKLREIVARPAAEGLTGNAASEAMLPHINNYRNLARLVQEDVHLAIDRGEYETAIEKIAAGFRIAEVVHDANEMNLITKLVSVAISGIMFGLVEEIIQCPDSPNLYWALASLPSDFWELRMAADGELASIARVLGPIMLPIAATATEQQYRQALLETAQTFVTMQGDMFDGRPDDGRQPEEVDVYARLLTGTVILAAADRARTELPSYGYDADSIGRMSDLEATARAMHLGLRDGSNRIFKWALLVDAPRGAMDQEIGQLVQWESLFSPANIVLGALLPAIQAGESACNRTKSIARRLMLYEALRAHVAEHGETPQRLADMTPLPEMHDPATGSSYFFKREGPRTAIISWDPLYPGERQTQVRLQFPE